MTQPTIAAFHSHIYFEAETRASAEKLRELLGQRFGSQLQHLGKLIDRPIGPHPLPMFEADFLPEHFGEVVFFLLHHHGVLSVLIHAVTGDDLRDHSAYALWLGRQLDLDVSQF